MKIQDKIQEFLESTTLSDIKNQRDLLPNDIEESIKKRTCEIINYDTGYFTTIPGDVVPGDRMLNIRCRFSSMFDDYMYVVDINFYNTNFSVKYLDLDDATIKSDLKYRKKVFTQLQKRANDIVDYVNTNYSGRKINMPEELRCEFQKLKSNIDNYALDFSDTLKNIWR